MAALVVFLFLTGEMKDGSKQEQLLLGRILEAELVSLLPKLFLYTVRDSRDGRLLYNEGLHTYNVHSALLHVLA